MKKLYAFIFLIFNFLNLVSQNSDSIYKLVHDPEAKKILDKLSKKYDKDTSMRIYFEYNIYNAQDSSEKSFYGYLFVKGKKYKLIIPDVEIFSDGQKVYAYNKKTNEMNINFEDPENTDVLTPNNILHIYEKGFKYRLRGVATFDAKVRKNNQNTTEHKECWVVDLYPEHPKGVPYSIIRIWIDKNKNELVSLKYQGKNGIDQVVNILEIKHNIFINNLLFKFDRKRYPQDMEIIDFTTEE